MAAVLTTKTAKDGASTPATFPYGFIDVSGTGAGPFYPVYGSVDAGANLINPATREGVAAIVTALGAPLITIQSAGVHTPAAPVATALSYTAGKCIGGPVALTNFVSAAGKSSLIQSALVRCASNVAVEIDAVIFRGPPTVLTGLADGATFAVGAADVALVGKILKFTAWDVLNATTGAVMSRIDGIGTYMGLSTGTSAYLQFVARGTVTLATANDLAGSLSLSQD